MSTDRASPSTSWILPVLFALLGGSGIILSSSGLSSPRPRSDTLLWNEAIDEGRAPARLWQDPLLAAQQKHEQELAAQRAAREARIAKTALQQPDTADPPAQEPPPQPTSTALDRLLRTIDTRRAEGLLVLGVGISGERWPGSEESRMADRYAVLAGLGARGYVPVEREYIDFFHADGVPKHVLERWRLSSPSGAPDFLVPYEWFIRDGAPTTSADPGSPADNPAAPDASEPPRHVLILWLRTDRISKDQRLATLEWLLHKQLRLLCAPRSDRTRIAILAPIGSNMLVDLLVEDSGVRTDNPPSCWAECTHCADRSARAPQMFGLPFRPLACTCSFKPSSPLAGVCFYSWNATISPDRLREQVAGRLSSDALASYSRVLDALAPSAAEPDLAIPTQERERRQVSLNCGATLTRTIGDDAQLANAIVSELGRRDALPAPGKRRILILHEWDTVYGRAMQSTFRTAFAAAGIPGVGAGNADQWFSTYAYLRGIDGVVPGAKPIEESGADARPSDRQTAPAADRPVGRAQFDYIRRLVAEIEKENERNIAEDKGRFSAIGVVGGDTYDKLVLLQAVRQAFPEIVLFTTDLEARLIHPSSSPFNLNVIVASHFGLTPDEPSRAAASAPASALTWRPPPFRNSYQTSLCAAARMAVDGPGAVISRPKPRLFEVARRGRAWDLQSGGMSLRWTHVILTPVAGVSLACFVALACWMFFRPNPRSAASEREWASFKRLTAALIAGTVVAPAIVALLLRAVASFEGQEPFLWTAGISAWPPVLIQTATIALSLCSLLAMFMMLSQSNDTLSRDFGLSPPSDRRDPLYAAIFRAFNRRSAPAAEYRPRIRILDWRPGPPQHETTAGQRSPARPIVVRFNRLFSSPPPDATPSSRDDIVDQYFDRGWPLARALRVGALSALVLLTVWPLAEAFGWPANPARGALSRLLFDLTSWTSFAAVCIVTIAVLDATRLCQRFIENLSIAKCGWGTHVLAKMKSEYGLDGKSAEHAADMLIVEERTRVVGNLFYFPVACAMLLSLSTLSIFDRWTWTFPAVLPFILCFGLTTLAAAALRIAAERARAEALRKLTALEGRSAAASSSAGSASQAADEGTGGPRSNAPHPTPSAPQHSESSAAENGRHDPPVIKTLPHTQPTRTQP